VEELERALLRLVSRLDKMLERLLARRRGAAAYNATVLVLLEVVAGQTAGRVVRRAVPDLRTGANAGRLATRLYVVAVGTLILTSAICHSGFYLNRRFFSRNEHSLSLCVFAFRTVFSIHCSRSASSSVGSNERACCREMEDR